MDLTSYEPLVDPPDLAVPTRELPRDVAYAHHLHLLEVRDQRVAGLIRAFEGSHDRETAPLVDDYLRTNSRFERGTEHLDIETYSLATDVALLVGDIVIGEYPNLHWAFSRAPRRFQEHQATVITGFSRVENESYEADVVDGRKIWAWRWVKFPEGDFTSKIFTVFDRRA